MLDLNTTKYLPSLIPISVSYVFSVEAAVIVVVIWATWSTLTILRVDQFDAQSYKALLFSGFDGHQLSFFSDTLLLQSDNQSASLSMIRVLDEICDKRSLGTGL